MLFCVYSDFAISIPKLDVFVFDVKNYIKLYFVLHIVSKLCALINMYVVVIEVDINKKAG